MGLRAIALLFISLHPFKLFTGSTCGARKTLYIVYASALHDYDDGTTLLVNMWLYNAKTEKSQESRHPLITIVCRRFCIDISLKVYLLFQGTESWSLGPYVCYLTNRNYHDLAWFLIQATWTTYWKKSTNVCPGLYTLEVISTTLGQIHINYFCLIQTLMEPWYFVENML